MPWDTPALGVSVLELVEPETVPAPTLDAALATLDLHCRTERIGLVTTRVGAEHLQTVAALSRAGFREVETSYALRLEPVAPPALAWRGAALPLEPASACDAPALAEFATRAFSHSRYHEDERIHPARANARMGHWIIDSLTNGDEILLTRRNHAIAALMSFRQCGDTVRFRLGGTAPEAGPVGGMFWAAVIGELARRGVRVIETRVSARHPAALKLHEAFGFVAGPPELGMTRILSDAAPLLASSPPDAARTT